MYYNKKIQHNENIIAEIKLTSENTNKHGRHPPLQNWYNRKRGAVTFQQKHLQNSHILNFLCLAGWWADYPPTACKKENTADFNEGCLTANRSAAWYKLFIIQI